MAGEQTSSTKKGLNLLDSTMLIMGSMIGSGIFIVSAGMARELHTPGLLLLAWVLTGIITVFGALSYGELAAMMPKAGGQYEYLKVAYGKLMAFLYGWTLFGVIQTGTIAAVAVAFAKFTGVFIPFISEQNYVLALGQTLVAAKDPATGQMIEHVHYAFSISTAQLLGIAVIALLTVSNFRAVKSGAMLQNVFTFAKIGAIVVMIGLGLYAGISGVGSSSHFSITDGTNPDWSMALIGILFSAMVGSLFSSDAWNNVTFTAGEVLRPQRNLPLSLAIATISVTGIYLLANVAYLYVLPITEIAGANNDRVATAVMQKVMGDAGMYFIAAMIIISTFGCLNGVILTGARVYYAMALDGLFFKQATQLNKNEVPANSLTLQGIWAAILVLSGSYGNLLDYIMFAVVLFYILTVIALILLRIRRPDMERPYRAVGYPVIPLLYILLAGTFCIMVVVNKPEFTLRGLAIILLGIPVYYFITRRSSSSV